MRKFPVRKSLWGNQGGGLQLVSKRLLGSPSNIYGQGHVILHKIYAFVAAQGSLLLFEGQWPLKSK